MEQFSATTSFELDRRRQKNDGTFPVKLLVIYNRKFKRYKTEFSLDPESFTKVLSPKPRGEFKDISIKLNFIEEKAIKIIKDLPVFTYEAFEKKFLISKNDWNDVFSFFDQQIDQIKKEGRISTASSYLVAKNSFRKFHRKDHLDFKDITVKFLEEYERWMISIGNSITSVGINNRCLRRIFNIAIFNGTVKRELYPFGAKSNGLYQPPVHNNIKKALDLSDIKKIFTYSSENPVEMYYRDLWIFSYLCNGMNFNDILHLKYKNMDGESMKFIRRKTLRSRKTSEIQVYLVKEAKEIIERWGKKPTEFDSYIFKGLYDNIDPLAKRAIIHQEIKQCNKYLNRIAKIIGIEFNLTTYVARHSFATVLKDSNEPVALISEALGHSSILVTENYLKSFQMEKRKKAAEKLTNWD
jgi:integrase